MIGLMALWFGPFIELEQTSGYFYLCPSCFEGQVGPHMEAVRERLAHAHPGPYLLPGEGDAQEDGGRAQEGEGDPAPS